MKPVISVAPMLDKTDRYYRWFFRLLSKHTLLYSEMISTHAIIHGDRNQHLDFFELEKPISLQLGGHQEDSLYQAVKIAEDWDYDEINLNVGCPSDKVQEAGIGACLMATPEKTARLIDAMQQATNKPVTIKHRIGINGRESYEEMLEFVDAVEKYHPARYIVHARIAILEGLSPKENRDIPPLRYEDVYKLKQDRPNLEIEINGGIKTMNQVAEHLQHVDGAMLGRAAYDTPYIFSTTDNRFFGSTDEAPSRRQLFESLIPFYQEQEALGVPGHRMTKHILGLFHGLPGARKFKQMLSPPMSTKIPASEALIQLLEILPTESLDRTDI